MLRKVSVFILLLVTGVAFALQSPVEMLQGTSDQMISALKANQSTLKNNPTYVYSLAKKIMLPHVDIEAMSRLALGKDNWTNATKDQRQQFMNEFTNLMLQTYATALASYTNEAIKFKPLRTDPSALARIQVDSVISQQGGPDIPVSYRLFAQDDEWKVYDITVDGVSMIQSFRSQFSNEISQGGMSGLLQSMEKHGATTT